MKYKICSKCTQPKRNSSSKLCQKCICEKTFKLKHLSDFRRKELFNLTEKFFSNLEKNNNNIGLFEFNELLNLHDEIFNANNYHFLELKPAIQVVLMVNNLKKFLLSV